MICRIAELQYKEVIDISDGTRYGFVEDVELEPGPEGTAAVTARLRYQGQALPVTVEVEPYS